MPYYLHVHTALQPEPIMFSLLDMALAFIAGALYAAGFLWCALLIGLRAAERDEHAHHS